MDLGVPHFEENRYSLKILRYGAIPSEYWCIGIGSIAGVGASLIE
jgi:hypothetical protein